MSFKIASSPHKHSLRSTGAVMRAVIYACIPAIAVQAYFFGWGNIIQILIASGAALATEAIILNMRGRSVARGLSDYSALLTGVLIGIAIPGYAPWWIAIIGSIFAIGVAKQLYGGLGFNLFNPAMAAYVMLLISFPVQMTAWMPPADLQSQSISFYDSLYTIMTGFTFDGYSLNQLRMSVDGITMATPLDTLKTELTLGLTAQEIFQSPVFALETGLGFGALGWEWINLAFLLGGLYLLKQKIINWHIPVAMIAALFVCALIGFLIAPDHSGGPLFHLFSGATMMGAFFIATDPVSASTTNKGRLIFGAIIGVLVYLVRSFGGYPDAVAFAVLIANMSVPLIDYYTRPKTYGHGQEAR